MKTKTAIKNIGLFLSLLTIGIFCLSTGVFSADSKHEHGASGKQKGAVNKRHDMMKLGMSRSDLTYEQVEALKEAKDEFREETRDMKHEIKVKNFELKAELAKKKPDFKTAMNIQKQISYYKAQLDEKHIEHFIKIKLINPYAMFMSKHMGMGKKCKMTGRGKGMAKKPCMMK